jgi:hypothetical protein
MPAVCIPSVSLRSTCMQHDVKHLWVDHLFRSGMHMPQHTRYTAATEGCVMHSTECH